MKRPSQAWSGVPNIRSSIRTLGRLGLALIAVAAVAATATSTASAACPNEAFRSGPSAKLPDCRAYELVTPVRVNGFPEAGTGSGAEALKFTAPPALASGDGYLWSIFGAGLPGTGSSGKQNLYEAVRTSSGWIQSLKSPLAIQAQGSVPGSPNAGHEYISFEVEGSRGGSLALCSCPISYVRYPDGSFHLLGEGTVPPIGADTDGFDNGMVDALQVFANWITPDGSHQLFGSTVQLTPNSPASGFSQYDRTPGGLKLVSILPDETAAPGSSTFAGSSADGSTVLFKNEGNLYARVDNQKSLKLADGSLGEVVPGGVLPDGSKAFYVQEGDIFVYDIQAEESLPVTSPGDALLVHVSPDGSHVYFISKAELVPGEGALGELNLYVTTGTSIQFIATVVEEDVFRGFLEPFAGLGLWSPGFQSRTTAVNANGMSNTARTTPDGRILVFESQAQLTGFSNEGFFEVYRYDSLTEELTCVSCSQAHPAASGDSELLSSSQDTGLPKVYPANEISNLTADGQQVVFESRDALLPKDINGVRDVYLWRDDTLSLISTGTAAQPSGLFGITPSSNDIFFETGERLVGEGQDEGSMAIYDARVRGGLASQQTQQGLECSGEACQGQPSPPPVLPMPGSATFHGRGNVKAPCKARRHKHRSNKAPNSKRKTHKKHCKPPRRRSSK